MVACSQKSSFRLKMGNSAGSLKKHIETAEKTGALNFTDKGLEKFPPDLAKVDLTSLASKFFYYFVEYRKSSTI
jgi:hypothetical protein